MSLKEPVIVGLCIFVLSIAVIGIYYEVDSLVKLPRGDFIHGAIIQNTKAFRFLISSNNTLTAQSAAGNFTLSCSGGLTCTSSSNQQKVFLTQGAVSAITSINSQNGPAITITNGPLRNLSVLSAGNTITIDANNTAQITNADHAGQGLFGSRLNATANTIKSLQCTGIINCSSNSTSVTATATDVDSSSATFGSNITSTATTPLPIYKNNTGVGMKFRQIVLGACLTGSVNGSSARINGTCTGTITSINGNAGPKITIDNVTINSGPNTQSITVNRINGTLDIHNSSSTVSLGLDGKYNVVGQQDQWVPAVAMWAPTTNAAIVSSQMETATNKIDYNAINFTSTKLSNASFIWTPPRNWDASTVKLSFYWFTNTTSTNNVQWSARGVASNNGSSIDVAQGTAQVIVSGNAGYQKLVISSYTPAITIGGSPVAGNHIVFTIAREHNSADTLASQAALIGVNIQYGIKQATSQ